MTISSSDNHALVLGASGITGWAIVNQLLNDYPAKGVFSRITAVTNRPLPAQYAQWSSDSRLQVVSGLDLLRGTQSDLEATMKEKIKEIESVSHVYFYCESRQWEEHDKTIRLTRWNCKQCSEWRHPTPPKGPGGVAPLHPTRVDHPGGLPAASTDAGRGLSTHPLNSIP